MVEIEILDFHSNTTYNSGLQDDTDLALYIIEVIAIAVFLLISSYACLIACLKCKNSPYNNCKRMKSMQKMGELNHQMVKEKSIELTRKKSLS